MPTLILSAEHAQQLLYVLANAEGPGIKWNVVNPLVMTVGQQLQQQAQAGGANGGLDQDRSAVGEYGNQTGQPTDLGLGSGEAARAKRSARN